MTWIFFALLTHLCWSFSNIGDKVVITKKFKNPFIYLFFGFCASAVILLFGLFVPISTPSLNTLFLSLLSAIFYVLLCFFYIKAVSVEEISRIGIIWNIAPVFGLVAAWIFLGEKLQIQQLFALFMLMTGAFLASFHARGSKLRFSRAIIYMFFACMAFSLYAVSAKYAMTGVSFATFYFFFTLWLAPSSFIFFISKKFRADFRVEKKNLTWSLFGVILLISLVARLGIMFNQLALARGPVALINAMEGFQTILMFLIAILLTRFFPKILREEIDKNNLFLKIASLCIMVGGVIYLSLQ